MGAGEADDLAGHGGARGLVHHDIEPAAQPHGGHRAGDLDQEAAHRHDPPEGFDLLHPGERRAGGVEAPSPVIPPLPAPSC